MESRSCFTTWNLQQTNVSASFQCFADICSEFCDQLRRIFHQSSVFSSEEVLQLNFTVFTVNTRSNGFDGYMMVLRVFLPDGHWEVF